MKTPLLFLCHLILCFNFSNAQEIFKDEQLGFSMEKPSNWIMANESQILHNLNEQIKLTPETLKKLIDQNKGTINVITYYKYPTDSINGVIPTIKVNIRKNGTKSLVSFKNSIELSYNSIKSYFPDFNFTTVPTIKEIDHKKVIYSQCSYTLKTKVKEEKVNVIVYAIPIRDTFYQITFMDSEKENCQDFFKKIAKTIQIN